MKRLTGPNIPKSLVLFIPPGESLAVQLKPLVFAGYPSLLVVGADACQGGGFWRLLSI